jgi:hypothetical protein
MHRPSAVKRKHTMATPNPLSSLKKLAAIKGDVNEYSDAGAARKQTLHTTGRSFLKGLAHDLGIPESEFNIRSNKAGIAVSGEVTLHSDKIYVQIHESSVGERGLSVLYRNCAGKKDYVGGMNHHIRMDQLQDGAYPGFVAKCKTLMENAPAPKVTARP